MGASVSANGGSTTVLPPGLGNAFLFATFNALSYQMILGSPMVLYAKTLDASATVLGIIAGMMPLLVIFQIPAASHVARVGYKRFVYAGWGTRVMFIFIMALVPLSGAFLNPTTQLALLLFLLFGFNLSRGISSAAWLPWITTLVPIAVRGRYLARDATCVHIASCAAFLLAGACLGHESLPWQFALIFAFSAVTGAVSLVFLKRIPDAAPPAEEVRAGGQVPWRAIAAYPPFLKLLRLNVAWSFAFGGVSTFTVAYLRAEAGLAEGTIMVVTGLAFLGGLSGLAYFESRTDRLGSKPVLTLCLGVWMVILAGWLLFASRLVTVRFSRVLVLELLMGFAYALVNMNNTRLAMVVVPVMGRSHFFALFSVVANLTLGIAPVCWGLVIDAFGDTHYRWGSFELNGFSFFFLGVLGVFGVTLLLSRQLDEPQARDVDELLREILSSPQRLWLRLFPRG
jgi:MFS family permease